jgi:glycolate oxidase FAD binding subunit
MMRMAPPVTGPADAVLGVRPSTVVEPGSLGEAAEAMRALAVDRLAVAFVGGGTDLELGAPPSRLDVVLRTRRLARIREHAPSDQIVAVEAGMTIAALQRALAPHGQRLALDPPEPERATVGGVVAANAFGPRRTRYGAVRDVVIGVTLVRADGVVARGGGKVVKNVAGFDLPRLLCGSLGTLGLVAEVVFRVHPLPEVSVTAVFDGLAGVDVQGAVPALRALAVEPTAVAAFAEGARFRLAVRFEGFAPGVRDQVERVLAATPGGARLEGAEEAALWARHDALRSAGTVRAKATFAPAALAVALDALAPLRDVLGARDDRAQEGGAARAPVTVYPTIGVAFVGGEVREVNAAAAAVASARAGLAPLGHGALVLGAAPAALRARSDVWGPPPPGIDVMRRLKRELDPDARLAPGRFVGGI